MQAEKPTVREICQIIEVDYKALTDSLRYVMIAEGGYFPLAQARVGASYIVDQLENLPNHIVDKLYTVQSFCYNLRNQFYWEVQITRNDIQTVKEKIANLIAWFAETYPEAGIDWESCK